MVIVIGVLSREPRGPTIGFPLRAPEPFTEPLLGKPKREPLREPLQEPLKDPLKDPLKEPPKAPPSERTLLRIFKGCWSPLNPEPLRNPKPYRSLKGTLNPIDPLREPETL